MAHLVVVVGPDAGKTIDLSAARTLWIGRNPEAVLASDPERYRSEGMAVVLAIGDPRASRLHARLDRAQAGWTVRDCGSSNGTIVGSEPVDARVLVAGDRIRVGGTTLEFHADPAGALPPSVEAAVSAAGAPPLSRGEAAFAGDGSAAGGDDGQGSVAGSSSDTDADADAEAEADGYSDSDAHSDSDTNDRVVDLPEEPVPRRSFGALFGLLGVAAACALGYLVLKTSSESTSESESGPAPRARGTASGTVVREAPASGGAASSSRSETRGSPRQDLPGGIHPGSRPEETPGDSFADLEADVRRHLGEKDFRTAAIAVSEWRERVPQDRASALEALDREVTDAASVGFEELKSRALSLADAGDFDGAREFLLGPSTRALEGQAETWTALLELLRRREESHLEARKAAEAGPALETERRVDEAIRLAEEAGEPGPDAEGSRAKACARIEKLFTEGGPAPVLRRRSRELRAAYLHVKEMLLLEERRRTVFAAKRIEWGEDSVRLRYEFSSDAELGDFHPRDDLPVVFGRLGKALSLQGEFRLGDEGAFLPPLRVRVRLAKGGWGPRVPNFGVALFVREADRLLPAGDAPPSLLTVPARGSVPGDHLAFAVGYKAAMAAYGDQHIHRLFVDGRGDPIEMPAHAGFTGRTGKMLGEDPRACFFAEGLLEGGLSAGAALEVELVHDERHVSWKVAGRTLFEASRPPEGASGGVRTPASDAARDLEARFWPARRRPGAVGIFARGPAIRIEILEVDARVLPSWLEGEVGEEAARAFDAAAGLGSERPRKTRGGDLPGSR